MIRLRDKCTRFELRAHAVLDDVRVGIEHPIETVMWALRLLGELD